MVEVVHMLSIQSSKSRDVWYCSVASLSEFDIRVGFREISSNLDQILRVRDDVKAASLETRSQYTEVEPMFTSPIVHSRKQESVIS
jgi:hypothetical protein